MSDYFYHVLATQSMYSIVRAFLVQTISVTHARLTAASSRMGGVYNQIPNGLDEVDVIIVGGKTCRSVAVRSRS